MPAVLDSLAQFVDEHGHYDPATRAAQLRDVLAVLEEARTFYRRVAETRRPSAPTGRLRPAGKR